MEIKIIAMTCPSCGAGLQVASDMENFACGYCGTSLRAIRRGGTVSLIADAIAKVQSGTDRTASELALVRLQAELETVEARLKLANSPRPVVPSQLVISKRPGIFTRILAKDRSSLFGLIAGSKIAQYELEESMRETHASDVKLSEVLMADGENARRSVNELEQQKQAILSEIAANKKIVRQSIG